MIWDKGSVLKPRASSLRVIVDHASLPGPPEFLDSSWCSFFLFPITQKDVSVWPYSVSILLEFSSLLATLHWRQDAADLGKFGISYFELLIMFEQHAGHRLNCEKAIRPPPPITETPGTLQFSSQYWARDLARVPVYSWSVQVFGRSPWRLGQIYPMPAQCTSHQAFACWETVWSWPVFPSP